MMKSTERIYKWDNLKCILMFLVVIGHFTNQLDENMIMKSVSLFIYAFHMPLFIFVSGLFSKKWDKDISFSWDKPLYYIFIGYALKIMIYLIKISFGKTPKFRFFSDTGIPWFMFAMAAFIVLTYMLRKLDWRICISASIALACLAGYFDWIGNFLYLSRILVFFPFYYMGYILEPEKVKRAVDHDSIKWISRFVLGMTGIVSVTQIRHIYSYIRLFTARNAYSAINVDGCGPMHRLAWYGLAVLMGLAVIALTPDQEYKLASKIGKRTLQIYFWHRLVLYIVIYSGFASDLIDAFPLVWPAIYIGLAVVITIMLVPKEFSLPLKLLKKWERRLLTPHMA